VILIALGQGGEGTREQAVAERGAPVMGFDLDRTTHRFTPTPTGGIQTVIADDPDDDAQIAIIRDHLQHEAARFRRGDFDDPIQIHGNDMPGIAILRRAQERLDVTFAVVEAGATITYESDDANVVAAVHEWFEAQLRDHGAHAEQGVSTRP
jgi:hypothetical protein